MSDRKLMLELEKKRINHGPPSGNTRERIEVRNERGQLVGIAYAEVPGLVGKHAPATKRERVRQESLEDHGYSEYGTMPPFDEQFSGAGRGSPRGPNGGTDEGGSGDNVGFWPFTGPTPIQPYRIRRPDGAVSRWANWFTTPSAELLKEFEADD